MKIQHRTKANLAICINKRVGFRSPYSLQRAVALPLKELSEDFDSLFERNFQVSCGAALSEQPDATHFSDGARTHGIVAL